jgi:hypothetical protein
VPCVAVAAPLGAFGQSQRAGSCTRWAKVNFALQNKNTRSYRIPVMQAGGVHVYLCAKKVRMDTCWLISTSKQHKPATNEDSSMHASV